MREATGRRLIHRQYSFLLYHMLLYTLAATFRFVIFIVSLADVQSEIRGGPIY